MRVVVLAAACGVRLHTLAAIAAIAAIPAVVVVRAVHVVEEVDLRLVLRAPLRMPLLPALAPRRLAPRPVLFAQAACNVR